jgi:hypothetical protein
MHRTPFRFFTPITLASLAALAATAAPLGAQCTWQPVGEGFNAGERAPEVKALHVHGGQLIAGGGFLHSGGESCELIAAWNGSTWEQIGAGLEGSVEAITTFNGELIVGGWIELDGEFQSVLRFDGADWHALEGGPDGSVWALAVYNDQLIAAGQFLQAGDTVVNHIAAWDGDSWNPIGNGIDDLFGGASINALAVYDGDLIAAGAFIEALEAPGNNIARWNGTTWSALGSGLEDSFNLAALALTVYNGELIVGGDFNLAGGQPTHNLARWNGNAWNDLDNPANDGRVYAFAEFNGELVAGKSNTDGGTGNMIDRWDGATWLPLEPHFTDTATIRALAVHDDALIAGGPYLELASGETANGVASWCAGGVSCPADIAPPAKGGDGVVGPADLAALLASWGACPDCPADFNGDNLVGPADLAQLLAGWGACE